jgi:alpha,alpha-trehalase
MSADPVPVLSPDRYDAVVFDLDGVLTDTASLHLEAWTELFDAFLAAREGRPVPSQPFTRADYLAHVDGRPRYEGVATFLASRGIELPRGDVADPPGRETVSGLGNRKNVLFRARVERGVEAWPSSVAVVRALREAGVATAVVSSSRNTRMVLDAAGIRDLFPVIVDGVDAAERGLPGKPDPATFLAAAAELGAAPERAVVVEDATAGVEAGARGGFGLVIGVDRGGNREALLRHGATVVVDDLGELRVAAAAGPATGAAR